jgi:hypothetical protein
VPNPKLSTLADSFGGTALNTTLWNTSSASPNVTLDATLDRVAVSCTTSYYSLGSTTWDATSSNIYARVVPAPTGNGSTQTFLEVLLDANNKASLYVSGGTFSAQVTNAGTATTTTIATVYDAYAYAWWRITEASGSFVFATSPDAYTWTTRATIAYTWAATAVKAQFVSGYYGTESASSAYIDHVNTTSSAPGQPNLNWPRIEEGWGPYWNANAATVPLDRYVEVTSRTRGSNSGQRGRQYELDQVRSAEYSVTLANPDAALDPTNASGPWYGHIDPYQPYRKRAQWPPTVNLLTQVQATGGDLGGYATGTIPGGSSGIGVLSATDATGGSIVATASAWQGGRAFQFTVPASTASGTRICYTGQPAMDPARTYSQQLRVRSITASTSMDVQAFISWYSAAGSLISTATGSTATLVGSASAGWTQVTVSATPPTAAAYCWLGVQTAATSPGSAVSVQVDGWQWEKAAVPSPWVAPGVWYPLHAGFVERWSSQWDLQGTYGVVQPTTVDAFSLLSQRDLSEVLAEEVNQYSPRFLFKLDDPQGSASAADATGSYPAAPLVVGKYGAGSVAFGTAITAASATGTYTGSAGTVATVNNANPGSSANSAATFLALHKAGIAGPANVSGTWTRMIAFRYTAGSIPAQGAEIWACFDNILGGNSRWQLYINNSGKVAFYLASASANTTFTGTATVTEGDWHLVIISYSHALAQLILSVDGTSTTYSSVNPAIEPAGLVSDSIGSLVDTVVGNATSYNYKGDLSYVAEFPSALTTADMTTIYTAWKNACSGESSDARYARILRYAGYTGPSSIQTGLTTSMGPASINGQDALSALQAVADTESGAHFVNRAGMITFKGRGARYNATVPVYTFGERADLGEWPYEDCQLDYDSTHLANQVTVTQESTSQTFNAQDVTSATSYFPRTMTRTINSSSALECQDAANYLLSRYKKPVTRVSSIKLHPSGQPALWPVCLNLELGTRVRVMRRPPGVPAIQVDCFVENIQWDMDDHGEAWVTLQCSPVDLTPYGVFASWRTTLQAGISAGATLITVNASADTTNPLAAQLAAGQQLVLDPGGATQETVTISAVGATSPGWTSATITLTAGTASAHSSGATVCEPLPSGITDPTTWDAVSKFDSVAFAY